VRGAPVRGDQHLIRVMDWGEQIATHPAPCHRFHNDVFQHSELLKITTSADRGHKGVSRAQNAKTPAVRSGGHQPGFSCDPREVPGFSGNLPEMSFGGYVIPFPFLVISGR
jgi:hypothetical protein